MSEEDLDLAPVSSPPATDTTMALLPRSQGQLIGGELLALYQQGIMALHDLYYAGSIQQVEAILPLYQAQTTILAQASSPLQRQAAQLASHSSRLQCELATDRENFGLAQQSGEEALDYATLAGDVNLQVAALIASANLFFHRKLSSAALHHYLHAVSLITARTQEITPLLTGRVYAGLAEVYAMRQDVEHTMRTMGQAYEVYPELPEQDPAYRYIRASRYSLYVFGDAQSRLFLGQAKEADQALTALQREQNVDPDIEPMTKLDLLYYQADIQQQRGELEPTTTALADGALLARTLGSRLYFNKLAASYHTLLTRWPQERAVTELEDLFQPW